MAAATLEDIVALLLKEQLSPQALDLQGEFKSLVDKPEESPFFKAAFESVRQGGQKSRDAITERTAPGGLQTQLLAESQTAEGQALTKAISGIVSEGLKGLTTFADLGSRLGTSGQQTAGQLKGAERVTNLNAANSRALFEEQKGLSREKATGAFNQDLFRLGTNLLFGGGAKGLFSGGGSLLGGTLNDIFGSGGGSLIDTFFDVGQPDFGEALGLGEDFFSGGNIDPFSIGETFEPFQFGPDGGLSGDFLPFSSGAASGVGAGLAGFESIAASSLAGEVLTAAEIAEITGIGASAGAGATAVGASSLSGLAGAAAIPLAVASIIGLFTGKGPFQPKKIVTPKEHGDANLLAAAQALGGNDTTPEGFTQLLGDTGFALFNFLQDPSGKGGIGNKQQVLDLGIRDFELDKLLADAPTGSPQDAIRAVANFLGINVLDTQFAFDENG